MAEENKNFETYIRQDSGCWKVVFSVGVQSFELDYDAESKEHAEWMKKQLDKALKSV